MIDAMPEMTPRERWKAVLDGRGDEIIDLAKINLFR